MMKFTLAVCAILAFTAPVVLGEVDAALAKACRDSEGNFAPCAATEENYLTQYDNFVKEYTEMFKGLDDMLDTALSVSPGDADANFLSKVVGRFGDCFKSLISIMVEVVKRARGTVIALLSHLQAVRVTTTECFSTYGIQQPIDLGKCALSNIWLSVKGGVSSQFQNLFNIVRDIFRDLIPKAFSTCFGSKE